MTSPTVIKSQGSLHTCDGIRLDADIYRPNTEGSYPVLLMRQPYGRAIASTVVYAHPAWYAAQGYVVVIQDVRGRGSSQGEFDPFVSEIADGYDTVQWAAGIPNSSGVVGMYGFSYQGMTQLYAAIGDPPALKALCPAMLAMDICRDMAYEQGAFVLGPNLGWALQLEAETARLRGDATAYGRLATPTLPVRDPLPTRPNVLQELAPDSFYFDWLNHPDPDADYWRHLSPHHLLHEVDLPMLHIGGWFDAYLRGSLRLYHAMAGRSIYPQHLVIGPWAHLPWGRYVGEVDFGPEAISPIDRLQIQWFDYWLKGQGSLPADPVQLFQMGSNRWETYPTWPTPQDVIYHLGSLGLAATEGGWLHRDPHSQGCDYLVHDPWRPVPSLGGHNGSPAGCFNRAALDTRADILTYDTDPLPHPLTLCGDPIFEMQYSSDAPSFDICAVLSVVRPDGVFNISQGYARIEGSLGQARIQLQATLTQLEEGSVLRLSLSGACFPAHPVNPGTGTREASIIEHRVITLCVEHSGSRLVLGGIPLNPP